MLSTRKQDRAFGHKGSYRTEFNIRLNNHRKHVTRKDSISASNYFDIRGYNFHANTIIRASTQYRLLTRGYTEHRNLNKNTPKNKNVRLKITNHVRF